MPVLLDSSLEILEMITVQLDVEQVLSLGSSCAFLARVVGQERVWRVLLARTELEEGWEEARAGYSFLTSFDNGDAIISMFHQNILYHYPSVYRAQVPTGGTASWSPSPTPPSYTPSVALGWSCWP